MRPIHTIIVHCSATESGTVESIRRYHKRVNGWSDIGYHYVIYPNGVVITGRPIEQVGAHCVGANAGSIGICLIGNRAFSDAQFKSLRKLVCQLKKTYKITRVAGHRDFPSAKKQKKTCPNFEVKQVLDA